MRACLLATRLARLEGLREPEAAAVYLTTLLRFVGCTATSLEYAQAFGGDDVTVRGRGDRVDPTVPAEALGLLWGLSHGAPALERVRLFAGLTGREVEVLRLLVRGRSERQIAEELVIATSTVHTHVVHIYDKTGVSTRAGAAVFAMEHGLIHPAPIT
jgi:DNA-binding CsgD family transcriptional regulator